MSQSQLFESSTTLLGIDLTRALDKSRKETHTAYCVDCNRKHCGVYHCEFCLADELYSRRKTMAFMRLDLTLQAAVCLLAKTGRLPQRAMTNLKLQSGTEGAQARGADKSSILGKGYSSMGTITRRLPDCVIYDELETPEGDDNAD